VIGLHSILRRIAAERQRAQSNCKPL